MEDTKTKKEEDFIVINGVKYSDNDNIPDLYCEFDDTDKEEVLTPEVLKDLELLD